MHYCLAANFTVWESSQLATKEIIWIQNTWPLDIPEQISIKINLINDHKHFNNDSRLVISKSQVKIFRGQQCTCFGISVTGLGTSDVFNQIGTSIIHFHLTTFGVECQTSKEQNPTKIKYKHKINKQFVSSKYSCFN